jgi:LmbE family N-acetylglucosaminyl deacetylase
MWFKPWLKAMRRWLSALVELAWHCGFLVAGRLRRSSARPWSSTGRERVLVISPHPDDEAIACSGTILRHVQAGDRVVVVIATDGRLSKVAATPAAMAAIRKSEATQAARRLGVERLEWLGLREGAWEVQELRRLLRELLERHAPTIIYAPSRVDFHPEHLAVAHALARALDPVTTGAGTRVRVYQVQVPLTRILTNVVDDVSPVLAQSVAALTAYESQAGSVESVHRRRRYGAVSHRARGPVEEFWEITCDQYALLHRAPSSEWSGKFRGVRRFAWTDPLAYLRGNAERRRLHLAAARADAPADVLPPFKSIARALRKTTEYLARQVVRSSESPPDWNELEWAIARSVAAMQGISALLANNLRWRGPAAWQSFLEEQREQSLLRDAAIGRLLERIDAATRDARIDCVALKGAALRVLGLYAPGERPMGDVDLLVREADAAATAAVMGSLGYRQSFVTERHAAYEPRDKSPTRGFGEHVDNPLKVEIHTAVAEALPVRKVDITARLRPARPHPGVNPYPSLAALLLHLLLHAAGSMRAHALRQIQLHDIALLTRRLVEADWQIMLDIASEAGELWWAFPPLALTARYYACEIPPEVLRKLHDRCPRALRGSSGRKVLTDVSWSNLRISAFPGIAWSRTPADVVRYVRSRALPHRSSLAALDEELRSQPQLSCVPWYQIPHSKRISRWLLSRPPRVQTIASVAAALKDS